MKLTSQLLQRKNSLARRPLTQALYQGHPECCGYHSDRQLGQQTVHAQHPFDNPEGAKRIEKPASQSTWQTSPRQRQGLNLTRLLT